MDRYLDLALPKRFMLQFRTANGNWMEEAVCLAAHANRLDDGSNAIGTDGTGIMITGIMIRCVEHLDDGFVHVDGGGERFIYRLVPLPPLPDA